MARKLCFFVGITAFFAVYELAAFLTKSPFVPHSPLVIARVASIIASAGFWKDVISTVCMVFAGIAVSVAAGIAMAIIMALSAAFRDAVSPTVEFMRHIPTIALFPILMALFGVSGFARVVLIALNSFPAVLLSAHHGISGVERSVVEAGMCDGAGDFRILMRIRIPLAVGDIMNGIRIAVGNGFVAIVVAEMLAATSGLGFMIVWASNSFDYPSAYAYIAMLSLIGIAVSRALKAIAEKIKGVVYA